MNPLGVAALGSLGLAYGDGRRRRTQHHGVEGTTGNTVEHERPERAEDHVLQHDRTQRLHGGRRPQQRPRDGDGAVAWPLVSGGRSCQRRRRRSSDETHRHERERREVPTRPGAPPRSTSRPSRCRSRLPPRQLPTLGHHRTRQSEGDIGRHRSHHPRSKRDVRPARAGVSPDAVSRAQAATL